jgi:hypothetical protein
MITSLLPPIVKLPTRTGLVSVLWNICALPLSQVKHQHPDRSNFLLTPKTPPQKNRGGI